MKRSTLFLLNYSICIYILIGTTLACKVYHKGPSSSQRYDINSKLVDEDTTILALIAPYKLELDAKMNEVIGVAERELIKKKPESSLGNWAADAIFNQCQIAYNQTIDFAVVNYGGLRIPAIPKGNITLGKIFELMPFDNEMVILSIKGDVVLQFFEHIAKKGGWPISRQVKCTFSRNGELLDVSINGEAVQHDKTYKIGMSDYIANGGDQCDFFIQQTQIKTGILFRDAFVHQIKDASKNQQKINAAVNNRTSIK